MTLLTLPLVDLQARNIHLRIEDETIPRNFEAAEHTGIFGALNDESEPVVEAW